ncbi:hypothetical protein GCM10027185_23320 [Spirosoma pulveris]
MYYTKVGTIVIKNYTIREIAKKHESSFTDGCVKLKVKFGQKDILQEHGKHKSSAGIEPTDDFSKWQNVQTRILCYKSGE